MQRSGNGHWVWRWICEGIYLWGYNWPGKNEDILKRHISLDLLYQTIETLDFPKWEFPQESRAGRRRSLQKEISHCFNSLPCHLAGRYWGPDKMGQWEGRASSRLGLRKSAYLQPSVSALLSLTSALWRWTCDLLFVLLWSEWMHLFFFIFHF